MSIALGLLIYGLVRKSAKFYIFSALIYIACSAITLYNDWTAIHQKKIIFFTLRKNYAAAFIDGKTAVLLTDLSPDDRNYKFFIEPALQQSQINTIRFTNLERDTVSKNFIKKDNQIVFYKYNILLIDEHFNYKKIVIDSKFSSVWLTANNKYNLQNLPKELTFRHLIIDATNKDYKIATFKKFAENNKIEAHILKKNPAYLVYLTQ